MAELEVLARAKLNSANTSEVTLTSPAPLFYAQHFDDDALASLAVELGIEDALPCAEIELALCDRQRGFVVEQQSLQMRVSVVFAGAVMFVFWAARGASSSSHLPMSSMSPSSRSLT